MVKPELTKFAQVRPLGTSFHYPPENVGSRFLNLHTSHNKNGEIQQSWEKNKTSNLSSSQLKHSGGHCSQANQFKSEFLIVNKSGRRRTKSSESREYPLSGPLKSSTNEIAGSAMQTLDRRISASSDNLDTLRKKKHRDKPLRTCSSSRLSFERKFTLEDMEMENDKLGFFGKNGSKRSRDGPKTPFEMFLEDDGPYSRKLYGPLTPTTPRNIQRTQERQSVLKRPEKILHSNIPESQARKERLVYTNMIVQNNKDDLECARSIKKGLLWQQKDKFFSRWKERFFILTKDYLHCFKKENSRISISEMGNFILKIKLSEVDSVSLLTKKGYLTISLSHVKDGRVFLRRHEGIKEWCSMIQANILESKRRHVHCKMSHIPSSAEEWLLARQNFADASPSTPYVSKHAKVTAGEESGESPDGTQSILNHENAEKMLGNNARGIHRLSLVADLIQNETVTTIAHKKNTDKHCEDSGLESGHSSMNAASDSQSNTSQSGGEESPLSPDTKIPDIVRTSQTSSSTRCDSFSIKTSQRRHYSRYNNLPVTIV